METESLNNQRNSEDNQVRTAQLAKDLQLYLQLKEEYEAHREQVENTVEALNVVSKRISCSLEHSSRAVLFEAFDSHYVCTLEEDFEMVNPPWEGINIEPVLSPQECIEEVSRSAKSSQ